MDSVEHKYGILFVIKTEIKQMMEAENNNI